MMLRLLGVLLAWAALCLASPVPRAAGPRCPASSLFKETLADIQALISEGSRRSPQLKNTLEAEEDVTTYLRAFIEALSSGKQRSKERLLAHKLQKILKDGKSCPGWMKQEWEPQEDKGFFSNLEHLVRFLNHFSYEEEEI